MPGDGVKAMRLAEITRRMSADGVPKRLGDERKLQKILRREWPGRQKGNQGGVSEMLS